MRAAIYTRISKDRSGLSANTGIQLRECRDYCIEQCWEIVAEFEENDISASRYSTKPRPLYERLITMIRAGSIDIIVATEGERLMRRPDEMSTLIDLAETYPLRIALTNDDGYDLTDSNGIYRARTGVALSERESRKISERQKRKKAAQAREGLPTGGRRPFGYLADMVTINEPEAVILREMATRVLAGHGYNEIASWANRNGHLTTTGKAFYGITICNLLKKPRYAGIRVHLGAQYPAVWPAVFDEKTWERLQIAQKLRSEKNVPKARKYLLTGLVECGACGGRMNGSKRRDRPDSPVRRVYQCISCRRVRRNADATDYWITEAVLTRLDSPEMHRLLVESDVAGDELGKRLAELRAQQSRIELLVEDYGSGVIDRSQFVRAKSAGESNLVKIEAAIHNLTRSGFAKTITMDGDLRRLWTETDSNDSRREIISLLIDSITVNPGSQKPYLPGTRWRFAPQLIDIAWKC